MLAIRPLAPEDAPAITALAANEEILRAGDHEPGLPRAAWARWIGAPDPNAGVVLGAFDDRELAGALKVGLTPHRRRTHVATCTLLSDDEDASRLLLKTALAACDDWYAVRRVELQAPASHRALPLFAELGFEPEARLARSVADIGGALRDEVILARVKPCSAAEPHALEIPARGPALEHLVVRDARARDAEELALTMSERSVVWGTLQLPHQRADRWAERIATNDPTRIVLLVADAGGKLAGAGAISRLESARRSHAAKLGMHVSERFQGRGVGRAIMDALLERAEHQLGVSRVELSVYPDNERAIRLYESAGFVYEGRCKSASFREGSYVDDVVMARVAGRGLDS
jgi:putative acetyltransferase